MSCEKVRSVQSTKCPKSLRTLKRYEVSRVRSGKGTKCPDTVRTQLSLSPTPTFLNPRSPLPSFGLCSVARHRGSRALAVNVPRRGSHPAPEGRDEHLLHQPRQGCPRPTRSVSGNGRLRTVEGTSVCFFWARHDILLSVV